MLSWACCCLVVLVPVFPGKFLCVSMWITKKTKLLMRMNCNKKESLCRCSLIQVSVRGSFSGRAASVLLHSREYLHCWKTSEFQPSHLLVMDCRAIGLRGILTISMSFRKLASLENIFKSLYLLQIKRKKGKLPNQIALFSCLKAQDRFTLSLVSSSRVWDLATDPDDCFLGQYLTWPSWKAKAFHF